MAGPPKNPSNIALSRHPMSHLRDCQRYPLSTSIHSCSHLLGRVNMTAETVIYIQKGGVKLSAVHGAGKHASDRAPTFIRVGTIRWWEALLPILIGKYAA